MNALPSQRWPEPPDNIELPELDSDELETVLSDLATEIGGTEASELHAALSEQIETLASAHWMLNQLFKRDCTISQLFDSQKQYTSRITSLRTLRKLTEQMSKRFDEMESLARLAKEADEAERARSDADEARADAYEERAA